MSKLKRKTTNEEELEDIEYVLEEIEPRFTLCPRCGSDTWEQLHTNKFGESNFCDQCKTETRH